MFKVDEAIEDIKSNKIKNIYFIQGDEEFYIDKFVSYIENDILTAAEKTFDLTTIYGKEASLNKIISYARRAPMLAKKQIILVKEAQELSDLNKESGKKSLIEYIKRPNPYSIVVIAYKNKSIDGRSQLSKLLSKTNSLLTTKKLYDSQIPKWIASYIKEKGKSITEKAIFMLLETNGNSLSKLTNEIDKICINLNQSEDIDDQIISKFVGMNKDYNIFELQNALINKDHIKVFKIVKYFESNPNSSPLLKIIPILYSFFLKILQLKKLQNESTNKNIAQALGINPYFLKDYLRASKNYSLHQTINNIHYLHSADLKIKGIEERSPSEANINKELFSQLLA